MQVRKKEGLSGRMHSVTDLTEEKAVSAFKAVLPYRAPPRGQSCWPHASSSNISKIAHTIIYELE